jgi:tripartite-type tricarboxylate transporter receptor subunit TctC
VSFVFSTMPPAVSNARAGKLRALAVTTPKRVGAVPEVPTMIEAGMPGFESVLYSGVLAPPGTPPAIVRRLNAEFAKVVADPDIKAVYEKLGADPLATTPEEFAAMLQKEIAKLAPIVRASGAKVE